jgi:hypothetical protein
MRYFATALTNPRNRYVRLRREMWGCAPPLSPLALNMRRRRYN